MPVTPPRPTRNVPLAGGRRPQQKPGSAPTDPGSPRSAHGAGSRDAAPRPAPEGSAPSQHVPLAGGRRPQRGPEAPQKEPGAPHRHRPASRPPRSLPRFSRTTSIGLACLAAVAAAALLLWLGRTAPTNQDPASGTGPAAQTAETTVGTWTTPKADISVTARQDRQGSLALAFLDRAVASLQDQGVQVGLYVQDLDTGNTLELASDRLFYPASTIKVAASTVAMEGGSAPLDAVEEALVVSSNEAYHEVLASVGRDEVSAWLTKNGAPQAGASAKTEAYPYLTPSELAHVWLAVDEFLQSDTEEASQLAGFLSASEYSVAGAMLRQNGTVYSKPGWYPNDENHCSATNDAGIVEDASGTYVFVIMTTADEDFDALRPLVMGIDLVEKDVLSRAEG